LNKKTYLALIALASVTVFGIKPSGATAPQPIAPATTTTTPTTTPTTTTTTTIPDWAINCPQWATLAVDVGFPDRLLPRLDHVIHRESRCLPDQLNARDPNGGSVGLTQINRFWCLPSRYYPNGYLQHVGVLSDCDALYDPRINLIAALALVNYSRSIGLCDWQQWAWIETPCESQQ